MSFWDSISDLFGGGGDSGGYDLGSIYDPGTGDPGAMGIDLGDMGTDQVSQGALGSAADALSSYSNNPADYGFTDAAQDYGQDYGYGNDPGTGDPGANGVGYGEQGTDQKSPLATVGSGTGKSTGSKLANGFGMKTTASGGIDWSDPKTLTNLLKVLGTGGSMLSSLMAKGKAANGQSSQQLMAQQPQNAYNQWNPTQQMRANQLFSQQYIPTPQRQPYQAGPSPIVPSRGYAEGGDVMPDDAGPLSQASGTPEGLVATDGHGQADDVPVNLSGGEYIIPADTVSTLGDGNNAAGAKVLDEWVRHIRERGRSTDMADNPPEALHPDEYLEGAE